ncbi:G3E family GTPase [Methanohalophilus levihalophilus]|uniref:GTP-binding protein n=1 Tax=Methanohalophilus levihalophilus TaxID=1431282 RepID=UPI001AE31D0D|nr:GTP-binding protein [Methanohalophilus levihalophilus]MBP2031295.1 G3E family GTPase [Methanohalophilus levihalophilus]
MKFIIMAGRPESGKRDAVFALGKKLVAQGQKGALIITEKGEYDSGYKDSSIPGLTVTELFLDCTPCSLRFVLEKMLKKMRNSDFIVIELSGSTLLLETRESLEPMKLPNLSFSPIVYFVNAETFRIDIPVYPEFFLSQIRDSDIICINRGSAGEGQVEDLRAFLIRINSNATILELPSVAASSKYQELFGLIE